MYCFEALYAIPKCIAARQQICGTIMQDTTHVRAPMQCLHENHTHMSAALPSARVVRGAITGAQALGGETSRWRGQTKEARAHCHRQPPHHAL